jgi:hypothetical protein
MTLAHALQKLFGTGTAGLGFGAPDVTGAAHNGVDWIMPAGSPVRSVASGTVTAVQGVVVAIQSAAGQVEEYRHITPGALTVGQQVTAGQQIGVVDPRTGSASTGYSYWVGTQEDWSTTPHVHFALVSTTAQALSDTGGVNPAPFLQSQAGNGGGMSFDLPAGWETQILTKIGAPATKNNIQSLDIWAYNEGGAGLANNAAYNPLNTTVTAPGSTSINSVGVQSFPSAAAGIAATAQTLLQSNFAYLKQALVWNLNSDQFGQLLTTANGGSGAMWGTTSWSKPNDYSVFGSAAATSTAPVTYGTVDPSSTGGSQPLTIDTTASSNPVTAATNSITRGLDLGKLGDWLTSDDLKTIRKYLALALIAVAGLVVLAELLRPGATATVAKAVTG